LRNTSGRDGRLGCPVERSEALKTRRHRDGLVGRIPHDPFASGAAVVTLSGAASIRWSLGTVRLR